MPLATPEMINMAENLMRYCAERKVDLVAQMSVEDDEIPYIGFHTTPTCDMKIQDTVSRLGPKAKAISLDIRTEGWYIGDVAWFVHWFTGICPDGTDLPVRGTTVMRKVNGEWKVAHWHVSEPVDRSANMIPKGKQ